MSRGYPDQFRDALARLEVAFRAFRECAPSGGAALDAAVDAVSLDWKSERPDQRFVADFVREFTDGEASVRSAIDMMAWLVMLVIGFAREASAAGATIDVVDERMRFIPADLQLLREDLTAERASLSTLLKGIARGTVMTPEKMARLDERLRVQEELFKRVNATPGNDLQNAASKAAGFAGGTELAAALGIPKGRRAAFFKMLERKRRELEGCRSEVANPKPNSPRFLYEVSSPLLQAIAEKYRDPRPD